METSKKPILVPWDFTKIAEYALEYAVKIAKNEGNEIHVLHIAKKAEEVEKLAGMLEIMAVEAFKKFNIKPKVIVKEGNIFTTIGEIAEDIKAELVVMGTHGIRGMQKLTGSWALKVIASSKIPFIIVQAPPVETRFESIVFPIDFKKENKEKVQWLVNLYQMFRPRIHILKTKNTDVRLVKNVNANIAFTKMILDQKNVEYEIVTAEGKKSFAKETIDYAQKIDAELILIMTTKNIGFTDYVFGADEQYIIANSAKIPVMCINPRSGVTTGGFTAMGG
jgi:nucleotide-binding universal stress UspA family protein